LREQLRDVDFQLSEARSQKTEYKTKIGMIHLRVPNLQRSDHKQTAPSLTTNKTADFTQPQESVASRGNQGSKDRDTELPQQNVSPIEPGTPNPETSKKVSAKDEEEFLEIDTVAVADEDAAVQNEGSQYRQVKVDTESNTIQEKTKSPSEKIATGDSQAIAVIQQGNRGFFTVDLWQVLLRIIGFERAAYRRGVQVANDQPNVMIV